MARLSQSQVARFIGVTPRTVRAWQDGLHASLEDNTYKLISLFIRSSSVINSLEQEREFWETARDANFKPEKGTVHGYSERFEPSRVRREPNSSEERQLNLIWSSCVFPTITQVGKEVVSKFLVRNIGNTSLRILEIGMCCRLGDTWGGTWADFPHSKNIHLKPSGEFSYIKKRKFDIPGTYFCEVCAVIEGSDQWLGVPSNEDYEGMKFPRIYFEVV